MPAEKSQLIAVILAVMIILLFLGLLFVTMLVYYRSKKKQLAVEKDNLALAFQQQLITGKLETQEYTLQQLSSELHDNIGQLLGTAKMMIGVAKRNSAVREESLAAAEETLGTAVQELRSLSKTLSKEWLEQFSFFDNLHTEMARINHSPEHQIVLETQLQQLPFGADRQLLLFRIVQEAINNACRHGKASAIRINITQADDKIMFCIEDNGKGFNSSEQPQGVGIMSMQRRADIMKAKFDIQTGRAGTRISIIIPHSIYDKDRIG